MIDLIYFTYNRLVSTKKTLPKLLKSVSEPFNLRIVDNGSSDGTQTYLKKNIDKLESSKCHNVELILNDKNMGISIPTNNFWAKAKSEFVGKIDNDILVFENWSASLLYLLRKVSFVAVAGHVHLPNKKQFTLKYSRYVMCYNKAKFMPCDHIGGNYIMKKWVIDLIGKELQVNNYNKMWQVSGWTEYQKENIFMKYGMCSAYPYPFEFWSHLVEGDEEYYLNVRNISKAEYLKGYRNW